MAVRRQKNAHSIRFPSCVSESMARRFPQQSTRPAMNYFAHGVRYLDQPYFLAGTATPDWLSVADRSARLRVRTVEPFLDHDDPRIAQFAAGVLQHLHDDRWFHKTRAFFEVTGELARLFRLHAVADDRFRASFLGHVVTELLLDDVLREQAPERLDAYYRVLESVESEFIESAVNRMSRGQTDRLAGFVVLFVRERFLYDYADPTRLLYRLNQVMHRVRLPRLAGSTLPAIVAGRKIVRERRGDLLPANEFGWPPPVMPETLVNRPLRGLP